MAMLPNEKEKWKSLANSKKDKFVESLRSSGHLQSFSPNCRLVSGEIDVENRTATFSYSSEEVIERDWGYEIALHDEGCVDHSRFNAGAAVLFNHEKDRVIGKTMEASVDDKRGMVKVKFSRNAFADDCFRDVQDGILTNVSPKLKINDYELFEAEDGKPVLVIRSHTPLEVSLVSIPSDFSVGIGRSIDNQKPDLNLGANAMAEGASAASAATDTKIDTTSLAAQVRKDEIARMQGIQQVAREYSASEEEAHKFMESNRSVEDFKLHLFEKMKSTGLKAPTKKSEVQGASLGISNREASNFSWHKAFKGRIDNNWDKAGFEHEVLRETSRALGKESEFERQNGTKSLFIPLDVLAHSQRDTQMGKDPAKYTGAGMEWVTESMAGDSFIGMIRDKLFAYALGCKFMFGLQGKVPFNKQTGDLDAVWFAEGESIPPSKIGTDRIIMEPKQLGINTSYSNQLLYTSGVAVDQVIKQDIAHMMARAIDSAVLFAEGGKAPKGIIPILTEDNSPYINQQVLTGGNSPLSFKHMLDLEAQVKPPAGSVPSLAYLTDRFVRGRLKMTPEAYATGNFIWKNNEINDTRAAITDVFEDVVTKKDNFRSMIYGAWNQVMIGTWQHLEIKFDETTLMDSNSVRVIAVQQSDIQFMHPECFSLIKDINLDLGIPGEDVKK